MTRILVAGDVCEDELVYGQAARFSRDTAAMPVLDVVEVRRITGGAAAAFRQVEALGVEAFLVPTGRAARKTRLIAVEGESERLIARFDEPWPVQDPQTFLDLLGAQDDFDAVLYSQYRPRSQRPHPAILRRLRACKRPRIGDVREPSHFAGVLDLVKVSMDDAWEGIERPRPRRSIDGARRVAKVMTMGYGFEWVILTMGPDGYVAANEAGTEIGEGGLSGAVRSVGAGDVFAATLTVMLAEGEEIRRALSLANRAAGLACRKNTHLPIVARGELDDV